jgi:integrase/recombinase XerD
MLARETTFSFRSPLRHWMTKFIQEKRGLGWRYDTEYAVLCRLDRHLCQIGLDSEQLTRPVVEQWTTAAVHEKPATQRVRIRLIRKFAQYLVREGLPAYCPPERTGPSRCSGHTPYIFTHDQSDALLAAADRLEPEGHAPLRHRIMPEVFRLLYGSGMRINEVLHLRVVDVDLDRGLLILRDGKSRRDRLVPVGSVMAKRLKEYASAFGQRAPDSPFFPAPDGGIYADSSIYTVFRSLLRVCRIPHGGRGRGPRMHDLRHTFAVHCLERWYREGADLASKLPYLSAYMGHRGLAGTQQYLRLTPEIFPDVALLMERFTGTAVPSRTTP